jgi:hypothetical protein
MRQAVSNSFHTMNSRKITVNGNLYYPGTNILQVQSRLRNAQPLDGDDINLLAMELLEMKAHRPQNGYGGMVSAF